MNIRAIVVDGIEMHIFFQDSIENPGDMLPRVGGICRDIIRTGKGGEFGDISVVRMARKMYPTFEVSRIERKPRRFFGLF